jgi:hypothetical protein
MCDLIIFLNNRLGEDERVARAAAQRNATPWIVDENIETPMPIGTWVTDTKDDGIVVARGEYVAHHVAHWDPQRVLTEIKVKRRVIELHAGDHECSTFNDSIGEIDNCVWVTNGDCSTMRLLAMPYSNHPDYRYEWVPGELWKS